MDSQFSAVAELCPLFATPWIAARQASLFITNYQSSLKLTSIDSVMPSSHLILCCPLFLLLQMPLSIRVFSNESLQMVTAAMKLKDAYSWKESYDQPR